MHAGVAKLADALDLGSSALRRAGSTPVTRTTNKNRDESLFLFIIDATTIKYVIIYLREVN